MQKNNTLAEQCEDVIRLWYDANRFVYSVQWRVTNVCLDTGPKDHYSLIKIYKDIYMFKKSLAAVAVLGALAGSAMAAEVTMYGVVDTGLMYQYYDEADGDATTDLEQHTLGLESGLNAASRFGLKGTEDLGNGLKVGFLLENGFKSDSGALGTDKTLFDREASVSVYSDFGTLSMGRMGGVASSAGTYDIVYKFADAFDGGDNEILGLAASSRADNMITYQTPKFSGVQGTFQYSFNQNGQEKEHRSKNDQYASAAVTGEFGALNVVGAYEYINRNADSLVRKDYQAFYLGGNYDCGFAKTFVMAQYFEGAADAMGIEAKDYTRVLNGVVTAKAKGLKGYGVHVGTVVPVMAGDLTVGLYYVDGKIEGFNDRYDLGKWSDFEDINASYIGGSARYVYPLSKRTSVYLGGGIAQNKVDTWNNNDSDKKVFIGQAYTGLTHRF